MKSVKDFFGEEKRRVNAGPTKDAIEDARKKLVQQFNRPTRVSANPSGYTITNLPGGNIPDEQKFANLEKLVKQRQSKSAAAASDVSPEARTTAANTAARARETRPGQRRPLGDTTRGGPVKVTQLKPTKPAPAPKPEVVKQSTVSRKAAAYRKKVAQQADKVLRSLQRGQETASRMSRAYEKNLARTGDAIISNIGAERKAETAVSKPRVSKNTALSTSTTTDIVKGTKGGKLTGTGIQPVKVVDVTKPSTTRPAQLPAGTGTRPSTSRPSTSRPSTTRPSTTRPSTTRPAQLPAGTTKTTTQPGRAPSTYRGTGAGRVEVSAAPKTQTKLLTPGQPTQQAVGTKPKEVKIPRPTKTPDLSRRKTYQDFVKQTLKQTNPTKYARQVQKRGMNIAKIRAGRGGSSGFFGGAMAAIDAVGTYNAARRSGETKQDSAKKAIAVGGGGLVGAELGTKFGAKIGSKLPGRLGLIGAGIGGLAGGLVGGTVGIEGGKALYRSQKDIDFANFATRRNQRGVSSDKAEFKSGNKAVIRDASGKERVGYKAYKGGKEVYKTGDTRSLAITSTNPLERIGRTVAGSNLGPVSDWLKSRYSASDEAARKKKVASLKA